jgi:hypothetical protein
MNIQEVRVNGLGNGFAVINPTDGYRKDNTVWFGECSVCGERLSNSRWTGVWVHTLREKNEQYGYISHTDLDYCPMSVA